MVDSLLLDFKIVDLKYSTNTKYAICTIFNSMLCISLLQYLADVIWSFTVKPVLRGHPFCRAKVATKDRWP